jgi:hypothetical protein
MRARVCRAHEARLYGLEGRAVSHLSASQRCLIEVQGSTIDGLTIHEGLARGSGHRPIVMRVGVVEVAGTGIQNVDVPDVSVSDVDVGDERAAAIEPRVIGFTPT